MGINLAVALTDHKQTAKFSTYSYLCFDVTHTKIYFFTDYKHISCQIVDIQGDIHLSTPQDVPSTIISGPFHATKAKDKCIGLGKFLNYTYIGVMGGYCVSVKNFTDHHSIPVNGQCEDGTGKYNPSSKTQYMDVYRIITSSGINRPQHGSTKSALHSTSGALPNARFNALHLCIMLFLGTLIMVL